MWVGVKVAVWSESRRRRESVGDWRDRGERERRERGERKVETEERGERGERGRGRGRHT